MVRSIIGSMLAVGLLVGMVGNVLASRAEDAKQEYEKALSLTPNLENGKRVYLTCAVCHRPEGWGSNNGNYPQIAGQLQSVIIKQLADFRARNRDNPIMYPFAVPRILGGAQEITDVAAYIAQLPMNPTNGVGPGHDLALGKRLYDENCVECHGKQGEGDFKDHIPAIWGQHYLYMVRQFEWIKMGKRRNADKKMMKQIRGFSPRDIQAVMDYTSRLSPPPERMAKAEWRNLDFPKYLRPHRPTPPNYGLAR